MKVRITTFVIFSLLLLLVGPIGANAKELDLDFAELLLQQTNYDFSVNLSSKMFEQDKKKELLPIDQAAALSGKNPENPHFAYQLALSLSDDGQREKADEQRRLAYSLFENSKNQKYSTIEMLEWAELAADQKSEAAAIEVAEKAYNQDKKNIEVARFLADAHMTNAFAVFLGVDINAPFENLISQFLSALLDILSRGNFDPIKVDLAKENVEKARYYHSVVLKNRQVEAVDYFNRGIFSVFDVVCQLVSTEMSRPIIGSEEEGERILLECAQKIVDAGYFDKAFALKHDDLRVKSVEVLWRLGKACLKEYRKNPEVDIKEAAKKYCVRERDSLKKMINSAPNPPAESWDTLACLSYIIEDGDAPIFALKALDIDPSMSNSFSIIMLYFSYEEMWDEVIEYALLKTQKDNSAFAYQIMAVAYAKKNDWETAEDVLLKAFTDNISANENPRALMSLGTILIQRGRFYEGISALKYAAIGKESDLIFISSLAVGYYFSGDIFQAEECLNIARKNLKPTNNGSSYVRLLILGLESKIDSALR